MAVHKIGLHTNTYDEFFAHDHSYSTFFPVVRQPGGFKALSLIFIFKITTPIQGLSF